MLDSRKDIYLSIIKDIYFLGMMYLARLGHLLVLFFIHLLTCQTQIGKIHVSIELLKYKKLWIIHSEKYMPQLSIISIHILHLVLNKIGQWPLLQWLRAILNSIYFNFSDHASFGRQVQFNTIIFTIFILFLYFLQELGFYAGNLKQTSHKKLIKA